MSVEVQATFAWAVVNRGGLVLGSGDGRAHVYMDEAQAQAAMLAELGSERLAVALVAIVPGGDQP